MGKYLKLFQTTSQYNAYTADTANFIKPNVSLITETNTVEYNPWVETMVVAKYNVTDTSNPTNIGYITSGFSAIEIDSVVQPSVVSSYTFSTTGEHTVKYTLVDTTKVVARAFTNCINLTNIIIPDSVTSIGGTTFRGCTSLTSIVIPSGITSIGNSAFKGCTSLTSIDIPDGVTSINAQTFYNCGLTSIDIPSGVTSIGNEAFATCYSLTSIEIPSGVTSIGNLAFGGCDDLISVICYATTPPTLGDDVFDEVDCQIYVPSGSVDTYKAASGWSEYASRIQAIP